MTAPLWTASSAQEATGGQATGQWQARGISIDTRSLQAGDLFIALKDIRDGHDFVTNAYAAGAAACLISKNVSEGPSLYVSDTLKALTLLAKAARKRSKAYRTAVTGSVGKTGVKEMLAQIFRAQGPAHWSERSYNNHWGVPLSLARMPQNTRLAVFELGMNHAGELTGLADIIRPHIAIITKIAPAHLAHFDNIEAIAHAKAEIFSGLAGPKIAILNGDDKYHTLLAMQARKAGARRIIRFGQNAACEFRLINYSAGTEQANIELQAMGLSYTLRLGAIGQHWAENALAALAAAHAADVDIDTAIAALEGFNPPSGRGKRFSIPLDSDSTFTLIDDAYNANPTSMRAAIDSLHFHVGRHYILALGDMLELGPQTKTLHAGLAENIEKAGIKYVFASGEHMKALIETLPEHIQTVWAKNPETLLEDIKKVICPGDVLLIKGSNASGINKLVEYVRTWGENNKLCPRFSEEV